LRAKPTHGDRTPFATIALDRNARDALQRFGKVLVFTLSAAWSDWRKPVTTMSCPVSSLAGGADGVGSVCAKATLGKNSASASAPTETPCCTVAAAEILRILHPPWASLSRDAD
jgi:hypothetical protein